MPRVSIILPVYNGAATICETVNSALSKSFSDFELIIIDDGSDDATPALLDAMSDPRMAIRRYPNAGLASSRNRGLSLAKGDLIAFLDADDLWLPEKLKLQVAALESRPEAALAFGWTDYIDERGRFIHAGQHAVPGDDLLNQLMVNNFIETGSNPLLRREAFHQCGNFDEALPAAEDWDLWLRVAARFPFVLVPQTLVLYRVHPGSMSSFDVIRQERCSLEVIARSFARAGAGAKLMRRSHANLYRYLTYRALTPPLSRGMAWIALRFWAASVKSDPALVFKFGYSAIALAKIAAALMLPSRLQRALLDLARSFIRPAPVAGVQTEARGLARSLER
jgi:glycosyltransferase involved in cell wall biosynthesis